MDRWPRSSTHGALVRGLRTAALASLCAVLVLLLGCAAPGAKPTAETGVLDLSGWSFASQGDVPLFGDWEICWDRLLEPGEACPGGWRPVPVPGLWSESTSGSPIGAKGIATYRLRVALPPSEGRVAIIAGGAYTAHRLFIDGALRGSAGVVAASPDGMEMGVRNRVYDLPVGAREVDLLVQVSNFEFRSGGLRRIWVIGLRASIDQAIGRATLREGMLFSVGVVIGLGYLALFALGRTERARGYFGLAALVLGLRAVPASLSSFGPLLAPWAGFALLTRLEYLGTAITIFVGTGYLRTKVEGVMPERPTWWLQLAGLALAAITLVAPFELMLATLPFQYILPVLVMTLCIGSYVRAWVKGVPGVRVTATASSLYLVAIVHDIVRTQSVGFGLPLELYPYALVIWILAEAWELMQRFYQTFARVELLSDELGEANFELQETESAIVRFVPFDFLRLLGKRSIREVDAGDRARTRMSVLCCGFHPSSRRASGDSPEREFERAGRTIERVERGIEQRGGFVNQLDSTGFQAFFPGQPADAVRAALEIVEVVEGELSIGIDTGPVVIGTLGGRQRLMRGVFGAPIEGARSLERRAETLGKRILISETTRAGLGEAAEPALRALAGEPDAFEIVSGKESVDGAAD